MSRLFGGGYGKSQPDVSPNRHCSEFEVNNWAISDFVIRKLFPIVGFKPFPLNEQMLILAAILRLRPTHIFEWGTNIGKSARIFHEVCKEFGINAEIHSIDLPDDMEHVEHPKERRGYLVRGITGVTLHQGDGLDTSLRILSRCGAADVSPLFFIDGDHSYESVRRELEGVIDRVPAANVLLHDTFYQSVESGYNIGPYKAIEDVLGKRTHSFRILSQNIGLPGMTLLWQPRSKRA
ncbi:MAG: class I SAM-dependent methyltransferase [Geobacter sp.]|nr:class I SAM-dependent methyltransferase [Geobacter sp.]